MDLPADFFLDSVRAVNIALWACVIGQSVAVVRSYFRAHHLVQNRKTNGLLPLHVWAIVIVFDGMITEVVITTVQRVGGPLVGWTIYNLALFMLSNVALWAVWIFERRRVVECLPITVLHLPHETLVLDDRRAIAEFHNGPERRARDIVTEHHYREDEDPLG